MPVVGLLGPMLGTNPGFVTSQGEVLAKLLRDDGYRVHLSSTRANRVARGADLVSASLRWGRAIDVAVVMVYSGLAFWQALLATAFLPRRTPLVLALHGGNLPEYVARRPGLVRYLLAKADVIVAPSPYLAGCFRDLGWEVTEIPNVIELDDYPYRHRDAVAPTLLWMRTFKDIYAPETAVHALRLLKDRFPDAQLTMAGQDSGLLDATKALVRRLDLDGSVRFPGFLDARRKREEFGAHDVYLHTNLVDNMPVSVVEAAAFGLPIVASRVGGIPHLLEHEVNALLVEPRDPAAMAESVARLVDSPSLASSLSTAGRRLAERSGWEHVRLQWRDVLGAVL